MSRISQFGSKCLEETLCYDSEEILSRFNQAKGGTLGLWSCGQEVSSPYSGADSADRDTTAFQGVLGVVYDMAMVGPFLYDVGN